MSHRKCIKCCRYLLGKVLDPHSLCLRCRPDPCAGDKLCVDCRHLSENQFKCFVAFWKKGDVSKVKKWSKSSGGSEEKRQLLESPGPSISRWTRRLEPFESDMLSVKVSLAQLSAALLCFALLCSVVSLMSDNSTVVAYLRNSGGTCSESLSVLAGKVLKWCESLSISLCPMFIPGHHNSIADVLSRKCVGSEWTLHPEVCRALFQVWGSPLVDLFATALTHHLPLYVSSLPDQAAWKGDAFSFPWEGLDLYTFPPFALIHRVLVRVWDSQCVRITLVAPLWPQADWFPLLLDLLVDSSQALPSWRSLLRQPHHHLLHKSPGLLRLHAWRLSSVSSELEGFHAGQLDSCPNQLDSPLLQFTRRSGESTVIGVSRGIWILALPLCEVGRFLPFSAGY